MKKRMRIASLLVIFAFVAMLMFRTQDAQAGGGWSGDCKWRLEDGVLTISGEGAMEDYSTEEPAPWGNDIRKLIVEDGVTNIGNCAFEGCANLTSVKISNSVTSIGWSAFYECSSLISVEIPNSVTSIGWNVFWGCSSLTSVKIPSSITKIEDMAFCDCINLTSVEISNGVTSIGDSAFYGCIKLTSVEIPSSVTSIEQCAFYKCSSLTSVEIPSGVTGISDFSFFDCTSLTSIEIPSSVTSIGRYAFNNCSSLVKIELPSSVTNIEYSAFYDCSNLEYIKLPSHLVLLGKYAFYNCSALESVIIEEGLTSIEGKTFASCEKLSKIVIPSTVTTIAESAFEGSLDLIIYGEENSFAETYATENGIPFVVTSGSGVTGDCTWTLEDGVLTISGEGAMEDYYANKLAPWGDDIRKVVMEDGVTNIGNHAFYGCSNLTSIEIPSSVTSIGKWAFGDCSSLTDIKIPSSVTTIGSAAFMFCSSLTSIEIPSGVTSIEGWMFWGCSSLTNIEIPSGVTNIGIEAFRSCSSLTGIEIPSGVTSIEKWAFYDCSNLKAIEIPSSVTNMGERVFYGCSALESVIIEGGLTSIAEKTFANCEKLSKIVIPSTVTAIAENAFEGCQDLIIYGEKNSFAETYATEQGIPFVPVNHPATSIQLDTNELQLEKGENYILTPTIEPENCTDEVVWSSADESVATVTKSGEVKAVGGGTTIITITVGNYSASCTVIVNVRPTSVTIIASKETLQEGETLQLEVSVLPEEATNKDVVYSSSDESIATVSEDGLVTALKPGTVAIVVTAVDGYGVTDVCIITITEKENSLVAMSGVTGDCTWTLEDGVLTISGEGAMGNYNNTSELAPWGVEIVKVIIEEGVVNVGNFAFYNCGSIASVELPDSITSIGRNAFTYCSSLISIKLPMKIRVIEIGLFLGCSNLINIELPEGITTIEMGAFSDCSSLTSIKLPESVVAIGERAFEGCSSLTGIKIPDGITAIEQLTFKGCSSLESVELPVGLISIGQSAFHSCSSLENIELPKELTEIGGGAFQKCSSLTSIELPEGIAAIKSLTFTDCSSLVKLVVPEGVTKITGLTLQNCPNLVIYGEPNSYAEEYALEKGIPFVYLEHPATAIRLNIDQLQLFIGETYQLEYIVEPENCTEEVIWTSSDEGVVTVDQNGYIVAVGEGIAIVTVVAGECSAECVVTVKLRTIENPFTDVAEGQYYHKPVLWAVENNITAGLTDTTFGPEVSCTRAQIVTFLWRAAGCPEVAGATNPFKDVPNDAYYTTAVLWAVEKGITAGLTETTFGPEEICTRAQIVTFLWRTAGCPEVVGATNPFKDVPSDAYYAQAVLWAVKNGVTAGLTDTTFGPEAACTRGQVVTFLYRAYVKE